MRVASEAAGISSDDVERHIASLLSFVRRRVTGDYTVDEFGFDEDFTRHFYLPVLRPLYKSWFRVEVRGIENIPAEGGGLVVANHSGTVAMDSLMTQVAVHDEHPAHRHLRMLGADLVFQTPVIGQVARKSGSTLAANPDAERLLSSGELVRGVARGLQGRRQAVQRALQAAAVRPRRLRLRRAQDGCADHPVLDRRAPRRSTRSSAT